MKIIKIVERRERSKGRGLREKIGDKIFLLYFEESRERGGRNMRKV